MFHLRDVLSWGSAGGLLLPDPSSNAVIRTDPSRPTHRHPFQLQIMPATSNIAGIWVRASAGFLLTLITESQTHTHIGDGGAAPRIRASPCARGYGADHRAHPPGKIET